jgi:hypothetical protein
MDEDCTKHNQRKKMYPRKNDKCSVFANCLKVTMDEDCTKHNPREE